MNTVFSAFSTFSNPIVHLFYRQKICTGSVFDFSWDTFMYQEKLQTRIMQMFGEWGRGGGGSSGGLSIIGFEKVDNRKQYNEYLGLEIRRNE